MKYIILCIIPILLCIIAGIAITRRGGSGTVKGPGRTKIMTAVLIVLLIVEVSLWYLAGYYHAGREAHGYMMSGRDVTVRKTADAYFFDGPGDSSALVFYPGALVEEKAYAPLMYKISEGGTDCFLIRVPFHMAMLGRNKAGGIMDEYDYDSWYLGGHSLGGATAASWYSENPDAADGIILLAAYPSEELPKQAGLLSIYGSEDGCLDRDLYNKNKQYWPADSTEMVIDGGNHAGFADYGPQKGDGKASISPEEQQERTADAVTAFVNK